MNAHSPMTSKRRLAAMAFVLLSGCALQDKTGTVTKEQSSQRLAAAPEQATPAPAIKPAINAAPELKSTQPAIASEPKPDSETSLSTGMKLYEAGDYNGAIRHLQNATRNWKGSKPDHVKVMKYIAFSYCLSGRKTLCRRNFIRALKIDPGFNLDAGEIGHPLWGPEFERAKGSLQTKAANHPVKKK